MYHMKYKDLRAAFVKHFVVFVFIFVMVLGIGLRLTNNVYWIWGNDAYDESRDMLVARHMVEYGDWVWRGPFAAGGQNILANSPFYYYVIAAIWYLTRSPEMFMVVWALLMASVIPIGYGVGSRLWDKSTGLWIALLFAVHPAFVGMSKLLSQVNLIPVWALLMIYLLTNIRPWNIFHITIGLSVLFLGFHIHYGSMIMLTGFGVWICWIWWHHAAVKSVLGRIIYPIILAEYLFLLWVYVSYKVAPFDQFNFIEINLEGSHPNVLMMFDRAIKDIGFSLWPSAYGYRAIFVAVIGLLGCVVGTMTNIFTPRVRNFCFWGAVCLISGYISASLYRGTLSVTYLYSLLPFYIIIFGLFMRHLFDKNRYIGAIVSVTILVYFWGFAVREMRPFTLESYYLKYEKIANAIVADYGKNNDVTQEAVPSFVLATLSSSPSLVYDAWGNGSSWYWLEKKYKKKLVNLSDTVTNFYPRVKDPRFFYVVCDHRESVDGAKICLKRFTGVRDYLSPSFDEIYHTSRFTVWKFYITSPVLSGVYNLAYDELLHKK